jgi:hypothetical protein
MTPIFRKIRKKTADGNKPSKYIKYALGEIVLVVVGILIALQLNNWNDTNNKTKLGYQYLAEMKSELQDDVYMLDKYISKLNKSIKDQESALNTKDLTQLPLDSLIMIISSINLDLEISELTFNKMKNLGKTSISDNYSLNSDILKYYNNDVERLKAAMRFVFNNLEKNINYYSYQQNKIDFSSFFSSSREFPSMYKKSEKETTKELKSNLVKFIQSNKGRGIVLYDLEGKRYSLTALNSIQGKTTNLLKSIYDELKIYDPQITPLPTLPSSAINSKK